VDQVTVRRWVDAPPAEVWRRVVDLDGLVVRDPELDLIDLTGEEVLRRGTVAVLSRRRGARQSTLRVEVVAADAPFRLVCCVTTHRTRWTVRIELTPCAEQATDLLAHADLDPATSGRRGLRSIVSSAETAAGKDVEALLESIGRRAAGSPVRR
jgi:hypothetical protein